MKDFALDDIKQLIDDPLTYTLTSDKFLDSRWDEPQNKTHLYYRLFYRLAKYLQPNFVVELGGWQGSAAAHFAAGYLKGIVVTIDHHTDAGDEINKARMLEAETEYSNLHYIQGWTNDDLAYREKGNHALGDAPSAMLSLMALPGYHSSIDILFVDSWHQYEEAMMDWRAYQPLLASPSLVICDDMMLDHDGPAIGGMSKFWDEFPEPKFLDATAHPGYPMGFVRYE